MASSIDSFIDAAREFCALSESENEFDVLVLWQVRDVLLRLLYHIPAVESAAHAAQHYGHRPNEESYRRICSRFSSGPFNFYRVVFDPHDFDSSDEPVTGMLSDDLADIYRDLAQGLSSSDSGHLEDACFEWASSYQFHWARHAVQALSAIEIFRTDSYLPLT